MVELLQFHQKDCPIHFKKQIIALMREEWPQAFGDQDEEVQWPENPATHPISFIYVEGDVVISHVAIPWKYIEHEGHTYKAFGLSEVMTHPSYRQQGCGLKLVKEAYSYIEKNQPDISTFTCQPSLVSFYTQGGWEYKENINLIGGTRNKPFRSDSLGLSTMMQLFSSTAKNSADSLEKTDIYLELGEGMLW